MSQSSNPTLSALNNANGNNELNVIIDTFIAKLKRKQIVGSYAIALETLQLLKRFTSAARWTHVTELITQLRALGLQLERAQPTAFTCGNIIRRLLAVLRDEMEEEAQELANENGMNDNNTGNNNSTSETLISSMFNLLQKPEEVQTNATKLLPSRNKRTKTDFRQIAIQGIKDLIDEVTNIDDGIQQIAIDLIHDHELLLTPTPESKTVLKFLIRARERAHRTFTVLVTEGFPSNTNSAQEFAKKLAQHDIETIIIPDSAVFALMSRVGKVIIGTKAVFVNGGSIASSSGVSTVCECAREFKTPVFAVAGLYKLSPLYPFNIEKSVEFGGAHEVLPRMDPEYRLDAVNKTTAYVPPDNIDIYITNIGGFAPSFIYRIAWDNYKQVDVHLDNKSSVEKSVKA